MIAPAVLVVVVVVVVVVDGWGGVVGCCGEEGVDVGLGVVGCEDMVELNLCQNKCETLHKKIVMKKRHLRSVISPLGCI